MKNLETDNVENIMSRSFKKCNTSWEIVNEEFEQFIEGFIVAETILGLSVYIQEEKTMYDVSYNHYVVRSPIKYMMQAKFYVLPMTNTVGIDIYEAAFGIILEECEELKPFNFKQFWRNGDNIPGDRLLTTNISLEKFYDLVQVLGNWWHYQT